MTSLLDIECPVSLAQPRGGGKLKVGVRIGVLNEEIRGLGEATKQAIEKSNRNIFSKIVYYLKIKKLANKKSSLVKNFESIITKRCEESKQELDFIRETVRGLNTLIAGAIGENSVVNELQKLPDNYYLINDFSLNFNPPIFNKNENDRIFSVQIDHLLVCQSGVFVIETKNWSNQAVKSLELRSPVEQTLRASYAVFVLLNSGSNLGLAHHHWGNKKIPVRNIIVMTNKSPKEEFQHIKVLPLSGLNGYIKYFDELFSKSEAENIFNYLNRSRDQNT